VDPFNDLRHGSAARTSWPTFPERRSDRAHRGVAGACERRCPAGRSAARFLSTDFMIELGARPFHVSIEQGRDRRRSDRGPLLNCGPWRFAFRGHATEGWRQSGRGGFRRRNFTIFSRSPNMPVFASRASCTRSWRTCLYLQGCAGGAAAAGGGSMTDGLSDHVRAIDPIVGPLPACRDWRAAHRIYFEEAGLGIPLVCLHTAGADGPPVPPPDVRYGDHRKHFASSLSTCRGMASRNRPLAGSTRNTA